jgi:hypothetical protein
MTTQEYTECDSFYVLAILVTCRAATHAASSPKTVNYWLQPACIVHSAGTCRMCTIPQTLSLSMCEGAGHETTLPWVYIINWISPNMVYIHIPRLLQSIGVHLFRNVNDEPGTSHQRYTRVILKRGNTGPLPFATVTADGNPAAHIIFSVFIWIEWLIVKL